MNLPVWPSFRPAISTYLLSRMQRSTLLGTFADLTRRFWSNVRINVETRNSLLFAQSLIGWFVDTEVIELPVTSNKNSRRNWLITDTDANRHESWSSNDLTEAYSGRRMNFDYFEVIPLCFLHLLRNIRICPAVASHKDVLLSFRSFYLSTLQVVTTQLLGIFTAYTGTQWVDRNPLQVLQGPRISFLQLK
jgi:hypothetical protein